MAVDNNTRTESMEGFRTSSQWENLFFSHHIISGLWLSSVITMPTHDAVLYHAAPRACTWISMSSVRQAIFPKRSSPRLMSQPAEPLVAKHKVVYVVYY